MIFENLQTLTAATSHVGGRSPFGAGSDAAPVAAALPDGIAHTERAAAAVRAFLIASGLAHYRIFYCSDLDLGDIDRHLAGLGEADARWVAPPPAVAGGEPVACLTYGNEAARGWDVGCLRLASFEVVLGRWYWVDAEGYFRSLHLCAVPAPEAFFKLHRAVLVQRRAQAESVWQIIGNGYSDAERVPRETVGENDLILSDALRARVEAEVVRFFSDEVAKLYAGMRVPYRRGVLLHGPPGNGKTSLIRFIGARLPQVPAMILRPSADFDSDDLKGVIKRWTSQAPAVLVVEDLDWLLKTVNVSTFLNLLDGIESAVNGGLLMIATTNHPDALDPAVNSRPGRFDVVVEIASPDQPTRVRFLAHRLPECSAATLREVAGETAGVSFAHLHEVVRLSGLLAIAAGRAARTDDDVLAAVRQVRQGFDDARRGFPPPAEMPFGLAHLHAQRRQQRETTGTTPAL